MTTGDSLHLGDLAIGVGFEFDEADLKRGLDAMERKYRPTLSARVEVPEIKVPKIELPTLSAVRAEIVKLGEQSAKVSRDQTAAGRLLEQQVKATGAAQVAAARTDAAESQARVARLREQQAQLSLSVRLSTQADREAAQAAKMAYAARQEAVNKLRLDYSQLRTALDANTITEAEFNQRGDQIIKTLKAMGAQADFTTRELKQLSDLHGRIAREQNSVANVLNPAGLSGNVAVGIRAALPGLLSGFQQLTALSPSLGAAASQVAGLGQAMGQVKVAAQGAAPYTLNVAQGMNGAGEAAAFMGGGMGLASVALGGLAVAAGVAGAAVNRSINDYAEFAHGMALISTLTDKMPAQLKSMGEELRNTSSSYGLAIGDIQGAMQEVLGAGVRGSEDQVAALQLVETSAKAAVASGSQARAVADLLTSALNAYRLSATDANRVSDLLFATVDIGKVSMAELASSLGLILPQAYDLNVPLEQVLGAVAALTKQGIGGAEAITAIGSAFTNIQKPSQDALDIAHDLGFEFGANAVKSKGFVAVLDDVSRATRGNSEQLARLFGDAQALRGATALTSNGLKDFKDVLDEMGQSAGATDRAYSKFSDDVVQKSNTLRESWKNLSGKIGEFFAPMKVAGLDALQALINKADELLSKFLKIRSVNGAGNDLLKLESELSGKREEKRAALEAMTQAKAAGQPVPKYLTDALKGIDAAILDLNSRIAAARAEQAQARADAFGPQAGPQLPGSATPTPGGAATSDTNSSEYQSRVAALALQKTGVQTADDVVNYCAQWVRLTLTKADKAAAANIGRFFQVDANRDGKQTANDAAANLRKEGLLRQYKSQKDLKPGDVVFYEDGGDGHVGVYIGGGLVRGNNRVTFKESGGKTPVGNVDINRLGTVTGFARPDDVAGRPVAGATGGASSTVPTVSAALITQAQRLLDKVEATKKAAQDKPNDSALKVAYSKATDELDKFTRANEANAAAMKAVQDTQARNARSAGQYVASQADLTKYGARALELTKALEVAQKSGSAAQVSAAERNIAAFVGESKVKKAVLDAEAQAYRVRQQNREKDKADDKKAQQEAAKVNEAIRQGDIAAARAALSKLEGLQAAALAHVKGNATEELRVATQYAGLVYAARKAVLDKEKKDRDADIRNSSDPKKVKDQALATSQSDYDTALKAAQSTKAATIKTAEDALDREQEKRLKERNARAAAAAEAARQGRIADARLALSDLEAYREQDLNTVKGNLTKTLNVEKTYANLIRDAKRKIAQAEFSDAKRDAENRNNAQTAADIRRAEVARNQASRAADREATNRVAAAQEGQTQKVKALREEYAKLATSMREKINTGKVEQADLDTFRLGMEASARAVRAAGVAGNRFVEGARASAEAVYQLAIDAQIASGAFDDVVDSYDRATKGGAQYTVSLERALELIPGGSEANRAYLQTLQELARDGKVSADTVEQVTQAIADQETIATLTAEALSRLTGEATDSAQALETAGDSAGALDTLTTALDGAMEAALRGEDATEAIGKLTDEINRLTADQAVTDTFNAFVAGLSGLIDEQVNQTVDYIATLSDPKLLAKAKAFLAELRSQLPTFPDPYAAGYVPGPQGFVNGGKTGSGVKLDAISQAQDLQTRLELETDLAQLQGIMAEVAEFLASALGATLPDATRQGLQEGVEGAQTYTGIQQGVADATAQGIRDGALRGTADAPPVPAVPTSQYDTLIDRIYELGDALKDPVQLQGLTESLQASRQAGELTEEQLQNLLALAQDFAGYTVPPEFQATLGNVQERVQALTDDFDAGRITAQEFSAGLTLSADDLAELATQAEGLGNLKLAGMIHDFAASLRGLNPEIAGALKSLGEVQEIAGYVIQVAGAFGQFAAAMGEAEQDYDRFTGKKLQTPWKDLAANLQGVQKLAQTVATVATDVMKLITNPADIGAWVSLITTVVSSIADAIAGFKKAQAEVQQLKDDFAADNPFLRPEDYQKAFTRSRGFFADVFGGGPEVVNEIDRLGLTFAKTMQGAFADGIKSGLTDALQQGKFSLFKDKLHEQVYGGLLSGMVDVFLNEELLKNIIAPAIKAWSDALKTPDPNDDVAALADIDAAVDQVDTAANRFYTDVYPKLKPIQDKWGVGPDKPDPAMPTPARELFGAAPEVQLGLSRIEVQFPAEALRGLTDFRDLVIPAQLALIADERLAFGEFRAFIAEARGTRGPPPLSGLAGSL